MSEHEFERFLASLSDLLHSRRRQRDELAGELRDHLEQRLNELLEDGLAPEEATQLAVSEFGEVADLAGAFEDAFKIRKRRWMMRLTATSIGLAIMAILMVFARLPDQGPGPAERLSAQEPAPASIDGTGRARINQRSSTEEANRLTELKLSQRVSAKFDGTSLSDFLTYMEDLTGVQFYVNKASLKQAGLKLDEAVSVKLKLVRGDMLLDLVLNELGDFGYVVRDGIVIISSLADLEGSTEVRIYNCRDLLQLKVSMLSSAVPRRGHEGGMMEAMMGGGNRLPMRNRRRRTGGASRMGGGGGAGMEGGGGDMGAMMGGSGGGGMGGMMGGGGSDRRRLTTNAEAAQLIRLITSTISAQSWRDAGGYGSVEEFTGLLVVNQNVGVHRQIEQMLAMLRRATTTPQSAPPKKLPSRRPRKSGRAAKEGTATKQNPFQ